MKIVFFSRLYWPHVGGVEKHIEKLCEILSKRHEITIVTSKYDQNLKDIEIYKNVKIIRIKEEGKIKTWAQILDLKDILGPADVIHIHDVYWWYLPWRILWPTKKTYITFHGYEGSDVPNWRKRLMHQIAFKLTKGNLCIGGFHEKYYGVKPTLISFGAVDKKELGDDRMLRQEKAIFIGRDAPDTGLAKYRLLAKNWHIQVDEHTTTPLASRFLAGYKYAFVSRYLAIIEALASGCIILAHYNNQIKYDYLTLNSPFHQFITVFKEPNIERVQTSKSLLSGGQTWALSQTWLKMANTYQKLWSQ